MPRSGLGSPEEEPRVDAASLAAVLRAVTHKPLWYQNQEDFVSREELASKAGVSVRTVDRYLNPKTSTVPLGMADTLLVAARRSLSDVEVLDG